MERYRKRISWPVRISEIGERAQLPPLPSGSVLIRLDERGQALSSVDLARKLERWRDSAHRECRFEIGAADGHDDRQREEADMLLSFGPATWPHLLVRAMLAEQLFRATSILANHPYHREG